MTAAVFDPDERQSRLRGRALRFVLVDELANREVMTVAEMVETMRRHGFKLGGRESKIISDALRWELRRGRVVRLARGVYRYGTAPRTTTRRIKRFAEATRAWIVAMTRPKPCADTPTDLPIGHPEATEPPWADFEWLWTS